MKKFINENLTIIVLVLLMALSITKISTRVKEIDKKTEKTIQAITSVKKELAKVKVELGKNAQKPSPKLDSGSCTLENAQKVVREYEENHRRLLKQQHHSKVRGSGKHRVQLAKPDQKTKVIEDRKVLVDQK